MENVELRGQLHNMASANVSLILEVNRLKNIVKDLKEENGSLQTRDREHVRDHVTLILWNYLQNKVQEFSCNLILQLPKSNVAEDKGALINNWKINLKRQRAGRGRR